MSVSLVSSKACVKKKPRDEPVVRRKEEIVQLVRLELYNRAQFCGTRAIRWRLADLAVCPLPSVRTIGRILARHELTRPRTGRYEPKGVAYPRLDAVRPNDVHQGDFVGPCYLRGGVRFYSLHSLDVTTKRCGVEPLVVGKQGVVPGLWALWRRLGIPKYEQVDNDLCFYGSPAHPRGMGKLIRLCLWHGVEPVFIPLREPWRNRAVEQCNDHWGDKFQRRVDMTTAADLTQESLAFETRHNLEWRYSGLAGQTPMQALAATRVTLRFPPSGDPPREPLPKPERGRYHVVRFIRSDGRMDVFGERFPVPPEAVYAYVWGDDRCARTDAVPLSRPGPDQSAGIPAAVVRDLPALPCSRCGGIFSRSRCGGTCQIGFRKVTLGKWAIGQSGNWAIRDENGAGPTQRSPSTQREGNSGILAP